MACSSMAEREKLINEQREAYEKAIRAHGRITTSLDETKQELRTPRRHHLTVAVVSPPPLDTLHRRALCY